MQRLSQHDPEEVGGFDIVAKLGSGGMGSVYLGKKGIDQVAIKVINGALLGDDQARQRFAREVETAKKLSSDFVARVIDADTDAPNPWLAMEYINAPSLQARVKEKGPLSADEWNDFAAKLLEALAHLQKFDVIHRDLKPSNILLAPAGPKLIDFGVATSADQTSITTTGSVLGSPAWLAPEQIEGTEVSTASDLFSLGAVLVYAATGRSPWGDESTQNAPAIFRRITEDDSDLSGLSPEQLDLVTRLMHPRPSARVKPSEGLRILQRNSGTEEKKKKEKKPKRQPSKGARGVLIGGAIALAAGAGIAGVVAVTDVPIPALLGSSGENTCVETFWVPEDLTDANIGDIERTVGRADLVTRECTTTEADKAFTVITEFCAYRGDSDPELDITTLRRFETTTGEIRSWGDSPQDGHGCRSFAEMGVVDWRDSFKETVSFQVSETIPADELATNTYILAGDNRGGTFVSRIGPVNDPERDVAMEVPLFGPANLDLAWESGTYYEGNDSGEDYVRATWETVGTAVVDHSCWEQVYIAEMDEANNTPTIQVEVSPGEWIDVPVTWEPPIPDSCLEEGYIYRPLRTSPHGLMPYLENGECVRIRLSAPETTSFASNKGFEPVLCATLQISRVPVDEEVVTQEELDLLRAFINDENRATEQGPAAWAEWTEANVYPGIFDTESREWREGINTLVADEEFWSTRPLIVRDENILADPDWVLPESPCAAPQIVPLPGKTFYLAGEQNYLDIVFHLTIRNGNVYKYFDACTL